VRAGGFVLVVSILGLAACKPPPPPPPQTVFVKVLDEAKAPVGNAEITASSQVLSVTSPEGLAQLAVGGRTGATWYVDVHCPPGYRSPGAPLEIRRLENVGETPEYVARCSRLRHKLMVNIKATGGANLPVLYLGKEVARTDAAGKAQVALEGDVLERIDLQLDTSAPSYAKKHPQMPTGSFEIPNLDGETTFEVKFTEDAKPKPRAFVRKGPIAM
jgi:hypothetical protein